MLAIVLASVQGAFLVQKEFAFARIGARGLSDTEGVIRLLLQDLFV
jgi:hypothetical protein